MLTAGVTGAALLQPPKSSSGATFGVGCEELPKPPPNADEWALEVAGVPPQAEKSEDIGIDAFRAGAAGLGFGAVVVAEGSGLAHASLEAQASLLLEKLENAVVAAGCADGGFGAGCEGAAGAERLKAELMLEDVVGAGIGACDFGAALGGVGSEKSKRSLEALVVPDLVDAGAGEGAKLKSPKSFEELGAKLARGTCGGFDAMAGFEASFGPVSKKPPPLSGDVICGAATDDR